MPLVIPDWGETTRRRSPHLGNRRNPLPFKALQLSQGTEGTGTNAR
jgi:hypothetical protein